MSKNYNKYYNSNNAINEVKNDIFKNETKNYNLVESEEKLEETTAVESVSEDVVRAETIDLPMEEDCEAIKPFYGINNCKKLNVRTEPNKEAEIVCVFDSTSKFEIEELESEPEWVKVFLENGEVGFCMKMYVAIR